MSDQGGDRDAEETGLRAAYDRAASIIGTTWAERFEVALEVERLRSAHRPRVVRVVLLAESHVWTSPEEIASRVTEPGGVETGFARFVYCLGYGETTLVQPPVAKNSGTPQYWRLFHDAVRGPDVVLDTIRRREQDSNARAKAKLDLFREMNIAGVWLVDASVTALYRPGGVRLAAGPRYRDVLAANWKAYVGPLVTANSEAIRPGIPI